MNDNHTISDTELSQQDQTSFYGIITEDVLSSKNISSECKLLFVKLTMMVKSKGYAWPSNKFLAEYFNVDETTIQRWLKILKDNDFISVHLEKHGMKTHRKIYINANSKNIVNHRKNEVVDTLHSETLDTSELRSSTPQNCGPTTITKNTNIKDMSVVSPPPEKVLSLSDKEKEKPKESKVLEDPMTKIKIRNGKNQEITIDPTEFFSRSLREKKNWALDEIKYAWNALASSSEAIWDWWRFLDGTIENYRQKQKSEQITKGNKSCQNMNQKNSKYKTESQKNSEETTDWQACPNVQKANAEWATFLSGLKTREI